MGSGFKDWAAGDVLTAADVDGYLMRQTVMTFADASARDTALSGVLDEGMVAYLEDVNALTVYNGSAWVAVIDSDVLTVDTANNRVGINDATPSYALDVTGDINATGDLRIGGTAIGERVAFTPSWRSGLTIGNGTDEWYYIRINEYILVYGNTALGPTSAITGGVTMYLPTGGTHTNMFTLCGQSFARNASPQAQYVGQVVPLGSDYVAFYITSTGGTYAENTGFSSTVPFTWATSDTFAGWFFYRQVP